MKEIEKKYLVRILPDLEGIKGSSITQGYINIDPEVRVRALDDEYFLTVKWGSNNVIGDKVEPDLLVREEHEVSISFDVFKMLYNAIKGRLIDKKRYRIPLGNYVAELDIYNNELNGLLTVEVEFPSEEEANAFVPPEWFGEDVTNDPRFKNRNLATNESIVGDLQEIMSSCKKRTLNNTNKNMGN